MFVNKRKGKGVQPVYLNILFLRYLFVVRVSLCVRNRPAFNAIVVFKHIFIKGWVFARFFLACIVVQRRKNDL